MNKPKLLDCSHHKMTNIVRFNEYNPQLSTKVIRDFKDIMKNNKFNEINNYKILPRKKDIFNLDREDNKK